MHQKYYEWGDYMTTLLTVTIELTGKKSIKDEDVSEFCGIINELIQSYGIPSKDIYELRLRSESYQSYLPYKFNGRLRDDIKKEIAAKKKDQKGGSDV